MAAVISVFTIWFAVVVVLGIAAIALAPRLHSPRWARATARRLTGLAGTDRAAARISAGAFVWLASWSVVLIVGWWLGLVARKLEHPLDRPVLRWFERNHLGGEWNRVWRQLTKIGSPALIQKVCIVAAFVLVVLYVRRRFWWLPTVTLALGYVAEFHAQIILKDVVHRGHPPTSLGSFPSGGMGRVLTLYGLMIFFVVLRFWPDRPRVWAAGGLLLMLLASIQAYARIVNLEHWLTDVIAGFFFGIMLLTMMILGYWTIAGRSQPRRLASSVRRPQQVDAEQLA